jgi:hypothetical protein
MRVTTEPESGMGYFKGQEEEEERKRKDFQKLRKCYRIID